MAGIRINAAAKLLGVSPSTLRTWEERHGFPSPQRSNGNHRNYELEELEALRDALRETSDVGTAVAIAKRRGRAPASDTRLTDAFEAFDEAAADRVMEESLAIRSLIGTVEQVLLPAVEGAFERSGRHAETEFAFRWATGWLHAAKRLAPVASRETGVMLLDAGPRFGIDSIHTQALELSLRMAGLRVLVLPPALPAGRFRSALAALEPSAAVICGSGGGEHTGLTGVADSASGLRVFGYRVEDRAGASELRSIGSAPAQATEDLLRELDAAQSSS